MSKVHFGLGERVRAYHGSDCNFGKIGVINAFRRNAYEVIFDGDVVPFFYTAEYSHNFLEKIIETNPSSATTVHKRKLIKRERINVINGKTQDGYVREMGHARGVQQFNTRCLGHTTGQAFLAIGRAMCTPGLEVWISGIDHAIGGNGVACKRTLDKHFRGVVQSLLGDLKGFSLTDTHLVYHPIQTVETYVEYKQ